MYRFNVDKETAKDIVQDTFLALTKYLSGGSELDHEKALIYKIAKNKLIDLSRKKNILSFDSDDACYDYGKRQSKHTLDQFGIPG